MEDYSKLTTEQLLDLFYNLGCADEGLRSFEFEQHDLKVIAIREEILSRVKS